MASRTILSVAVGSAIAVAGLVGGTIVMASNDKPAGDTHSAVSAGLNLDQADSDAYIAALAKKLNITEQTLKDAIKATNLDFLDKAVTDGKLTQAQADKIRAAIESGQAGGFGIGRGFGMGGHDMGRGGKDHAGVFGPVMLGGDGVAKFLGLADAAALRTEMQSGKSLTEVASAHGKSRDELKAFLTAEADKVAADAVTNSKLTQDQADKLKKQFLDNLDQMIDMKMGSMERGSHMGPNGMPGFGQSTRGTSQGQSQ